MEGINSSEVGKNWEGLKEQTKSRAQELIEGIDDYENLSNAEKITALRDLLNTLAEDNKNRFVAEAIATQLSILIEEDRHAERMSYLTRAA